MNSSIIMAVTIVLLYLAAFTLFIFYLLWRPDIGQKKGDKRSLVSSEESDRLKKEVVKTEAEQAETETEELKKGRKRTSSLLSGKIAPSGYNNYLRKLLVYSGSSGGITIERLMILKLFMSLGAALLASPLMAFSGSRTVRLFAIIAFAIIAFFIPDIRLNNRADKRQRQLNASLSDSLDLLTINVEAGLGFESALNRVVENTHGPLAEEFFRVLQEIQLGVSRRQAFRNMIDRTRASELQYFVTTIIQADAYGISIAKVLRSQSKEIKIKRRQKAEETAIKAPVKIVFPLILCIFPALLVIILGPAGIRIADTLAQMGQ